MIADETLLAIQAAVEAAQTIGQALDTAALAQALGVPRETLGLYVVDNALTAEARNRLTQLVGGNTGVKPKTRGVDKVKRKARGPNVRLAPDYWPTLKFEVHSVRPFNARAFGDRYSVPHSTVRRHVKTLREQSASQAMGLGSVAPTAPRRFGSVMRRVEPQDLLALRDERARGGPFDRSDWAQERSLSIYSVCKYVTLEGELTELGLSLLDQDSLARKMHDSVS
ncbi:hypothetical protein [Pandoraea pulmonicola]|uniref:Uncharacterized protein n=1 Tax=Pandoraea pulmonicola TaxID=93221 RepID=A0ABM5S1F1_PANPU|nr:hypothetical protein [Pandoraea pulmonicola]AJC21554.1 hypothetical protein RO07_15575 [Pandoraea pulmonicola]